MRVAQQRSNYPPPFSCSSTCGRSASTEMTGRGILSLKVPSRSPLSTNDFLLFGDPKFLCLVSLAPNATCDWRKPVPGVCGCRSTRPHLACGPVELNIRVAARYGLLIRILPYPLPILVSRDARRPVGAKLLV